jgi:hypothetical protein
MPVDDLIELIAPGGCDEANHGTMKYRVDNDGHVRVPREAAQWFIRYGGFRPAPIFEATTAPQKEGNGAERGKPIPAKPSTRTAAPQRSETP